MTFVFYFVSFVYATHNYSCEKVQWSLHSKEAIGLNGACHIIIGVLLVVISSLVVFIWGWVFLGKKVEMCDREEQI